jgi:archaellum component FlaC
MTNLEYNLEKRVEALFNNEIKKELHKKADETSRKVQTIRKSDAVENLQEKFKGMQKTLENLTNELISLGNQYLNEFEKEIDNVDEPMKTQAVDKLKDLIVSEIQELVKNGTLNKFHE